MTESKITHSIDICKFGADRYYIEDIFRSTVVGYPIFDFLIIATSEIRSFGRLTIPDTMRRIKVDK
jgi:hypothetical protein